MIAIENKYRLIQQISHNEKYDIWEAFDLQLERKIIIEIFTDPKIEQKLKDKILAYTKINDSNLVSIYSVGMFQNQPYIVLEYIEGKSISTFTPYSLKDWMTLALFFKQITHALHSLHEQKLGHYHITADNVIINSNNEAILLIDFPKLLLEDNVVWLFDDIIALGDLIQAFFKDNRVPLQLLEIVNKTKQCRLIEYPTANILQDLEEFLATDKPKFVNTSPEIFPKKWVFIGILFIIFSYFVVKYFYDHGAFKKRIIESSPRELDGYRVLDSLKLQKMGEEIKQIRTLKEVEENLNTQKNIEDDVENLQTQQKEQELAPEMQEKLLKIQKQYDELMQVIDEKQKKLKKYSKERVALEEQKSSLTEKIAESQKNIEQLLQHKNDAQNQYNLLESDMNLKKREYQKSINLWKKYQSQFTKTEKEIKQIKNKITKAKEDRKELEKNLAVIKSDRMQLEYTMKREKLRVQTAKNNVDNLNPRTKNSEMASDFKKQYSKAKSDYEQKERELKQMDTKIQRLNFDLERNSKNIKKLERDLEDKQEYCKKLEHFKKQSQDFDTIQNKLETKKQDIEDISTQYNQEKEKERSLNEEFNEVQTDFLIRNENCNSIQYEIRNAEKKAQQLRQQLQSLQEKK